MSGEILLRIGIGLFAVAAPCAAIVSRRSLFVLLPVAALLMIIGSLLLPGAANLVLRNARAALMRPLVILTIVLLIWSGLSFVWTPFPALATERYLRTTGTVLITLAAIGCLPTRGKPVWCNMLPIGVLAAALATIAFVLLTQKPPQTEADVGDTLWRAVAGLVALVWPAMMTLVTRGRIALAGLLWLCVAGAALLVGATIALTALLAGGAVFCAAYAASERVAKILGAAMAALLLSAPVLILAIDPLAARLDPEGPFGQLHVWADIVRSEGLKLITGHGFDTAVRASTAGLLPAGAPRGILFEIWYELGLVGIGVFAILMWCAFTDAAQMGRATGALLMAGVATVLAISIAGISISQLWWTTQLAGVALAFAVALRTQARETTRAPTLNQRPVLKI